MTTNSKTREEQSEPCFEGMYGPYCITLQDQREVQLYRICLLVCGLSFSAGLGQWILIGPQLAPLWLLPLAVSLGLALRWIHIYLRPLHQALQLFWAAGCIGWLVLAMQAGPSNIFNTLESQRLWTLAIGPLFASLAGIGFKEFFCFRRPEAIGLTLLLPVALLGHLSGLIPGPVAISMLAICSSLLVLLALRKFGMEAAADVGDKSVFAYLEDLRKAKSA
ncbi:DUF2301 domain-containing membrane protein [Synechococcus sp. AH-707-M23]|jgi:uncharacterized integral membrane protein|nr:DUF2301 domain-containing membrane protein [Synechococcus sp. AH-707-M23]